MKRLIIFLVVTFTSLNMAVAQDAFSGAPNSGAGEFIKLKDVLDDPNRGFCIDIPGHLRSTNINARLNVHTCKDGFWNYDERFSPDALEKSGLLFMPAIKRCVVVTGIKQDAHLRLAECDANDTRQRWELVEGQLRLKAKPGLCVEVDAEPSEVSVGTRNHPVRHLVRPISLANCVEGGNKYQQWAFVEPSDIPGIRYPDGRPGGW